VNKIPFARFKAAYLDFDNLMTFVSGVPQRSLPQVPNQYIESTVLVAAVCQIFGILPRTSTTAKKLPRQRSAAFESGMLG